MYISSLPQFYINNMVLLELEKMRKIAFVLGVGNKFI
jgi:hypothetical protein